MNKPRTYEELLADNQRLQTENKRLCLEIERLKDLFLNKSASEYNTRQPDHAIYIFMSEYYPQKYIFMGEYSS